MDTAIVISQFPCDDEVFILRELGALSRKGVGLRIFSLKAPSGRALHAEAARLAGAAVYSPFLLSVEVLRRNLALLLRRPLFYLGLVGTILREAWRSPAFLWRSLAVFPKAVRWGMELREHPCQRIHAHWATHPSTAAWVMSRISGIPFSITAHAHDIYLDQSMLVFKLRRAAAVLTCTRQNLEFLKALAPDLPAARIRLSYHGIDLGIYHPAAASPEVFRILAVGTLLPRKGFGVLLEASAILEKEGIRHECLLVGDGPQRPQLEERKAVLGVRSFHLMGKKSQEELPGIYRESSVLVMPALHRDMSAGMALGPRASDLIHFGIPNVILEAMATGLPVVSTRLPAVAEVLEHGVNGLYVSQEDPRALAEALKEIASQGGKCAAMGERSLERIRSGFDLERTSGEVLEALRSAT